MPDLEPPVDGPTAPTVSPFELLSVLWRRKAVVITTVIASVVVAFALSARSSKEYSASSELLFRDPGFAQALFGNNLFATGQQEPQRTTQTSIDVVGSRNVARRAAVLLGNGEPIDSLLGSITVTPNSDADIATIEAKRSSPQEAAAVANAFAQGYITYRRETDRSTVAQAEALVTQSIKTASPAEQLKLDESLRQLGVLRSLQTGDAELIASAQPNSTPVSPKPKRDAILGFVVGLLLGCGLALVADFVDRRIKTLEDFERVCPDYPLIASVPHTPSGLAIERQLTGPSGEAYRMLREGLRFLDPTGRARCLIITSAEEGEGKSTAAVNLASALAAVGRNVMLLEGDMRRPTAAAMLGGRPGVRGLSDMLVSDQPMEDFVVPVKGHPGLKMIPSGTLPPNSADLLSIGRMADVLTFARENADFVIIDSPPLLPVADTRVLLRLAGVDGVIMIGRAGVSRRDRIRAAARVLGQSGQKVFGLVVTDVKLQADSVYYQYGLDESQEPQKRSRSARAKHNGQSRSAAQSTKQAPGVRSPS
ncbi:MAG TPA: polysaccharide biosynthesis tyrosine autokinase [Solirubrobacteraceae bacterium]